MGRKRKNPPSEWEIFHNILADLLLSLRIKKTGKPFLMVEYFGSLKEIKRVCNQLLAIIEVLESKQEAAEKQTLQESVRRYNRGLSNQARREKVSNNHHMYRSWDKRRMPNSEGADD